MLRQARALGLLLLLLAGCLDPRSHAQIVEDYDKDHDLDVRTVIDVTDIDEDGLMRVQGVGLVTGLAGTGNCPAGPYRDLLEQYLLKASGPRDGQITAENVHLKVRQILNDNNNAMVFVTGYIPVGARRGDHFDVEVTVPKESRTTSLAGGTLELCVLRIYESVAALTNDPLKKTSGTLLPGHVFAHAKGKLMVGFGGHSDAHEVLRARVWQGGVARIDRPYVFRMKKDEKSVKIAADVADRINYLYQDNKGSRELLRAGLTNGLLSEQQKQILLMENVTKQLNSSQDKAPFTQDNVAKATKECVINIRVPYAYRLNHERFLRVSRLTPLAYNDPSMGRYKARLQKMLLDPTQTVRAAIRLEALGRDTAIPLLKPALTHEHPFVRFAAAEALAYLEDISGVETLGKLARQYPLLVKHCTTALASLGESYARDQLADLMTTPDPALACAAFHALTLSKEDDPRLGGALLNDTFWLYRVPPAATPMVYFGASKKTQVLLMGRTIVFAPIGPMLVGAHQEFTVVPADEKKDHFRIKRFHNGAEEQRICPNRLDAVLFALADLGASYPDIVDFLRAAQERQAVSCPIVPFSVPDVTLNTLFLEGPKLQKQAAGSGQ
jgi:hypothetical protein